jgi:hypothetical protein
MVSWEVNPDAKIVGRIGKSPQSLGLTVNKDGCPDVLQFNDGTFGFIGRDVTDRYADELPDGMSIRHDERLVMLPAESVLAAKADIPDA